jgi:hypothetical protein
MMLLCAMRPDNGPVDRSSIHPLKQPQHMSKKIRIQAADRTFTATLEDGPATDALLKLLPVTIAMHELNENEKYGDLPKKLPPNASVPDRIEAGDIMLFGTNTLVLFYRPFHTTYSYTRIGRVDDPKRLEAALGDGDVEVNWSE